MSIIVCLIFCAALFGLEFFHRREMVKIMRGFVPREKKTTVTKHISPHRKALEKQRRINK